MKELNLILLKTHGVTWDEYKSSLSGPSKKNLAYVQGHNKDLGYQEIIYDKELVRKYMAMWEEQPIRGEKRQWAFNIHHISSLDEGNEMRFFIGYDRHSQNTMAVHFIQKHPDGFWECHPPMWNKTGVNKKRYLAKFMWFRLIKFAISDKDIKWLDFGGGDDASWRQMIKDREQYPNPGYKWLYIPEDVKENPEGQPDYTLIRDGWNRRYEEI